MLEIFRIFDTFNLPVVAVEKSELESAQVVNEKIRRCQTQSDLEGGVRGREVPIELAFAQTAISQGFGTAGVQLQRVVDGPPGRRQIRCARYYCWQGPSEA